MASSGKTGSAAALEAAAAKAEIPASAAIENSRRLGDFLCCDSLIMRALFRIPVTQNTTIPESAEWGPSVNVANNLLSDTERGEKVGLVCRVRTVMSQARLGLLPRLARI